MSSPERAMITEESLAQTAEAIQTGYQTDFHFSEGIIEGTSNSTYRTFLVDRLNYWDSVARQHPPYRETVLNLGHALNDAMVAKRTYGVSVNNTYSFGLVKDRQAGRFLRDVMLARLDPENVTPQASYEEADKMLEEIGVPLEGSDVPVRVLTFKGIVTSVLVNKGLQLPEKNKAILLPTVSPGRKDV